MRTGVYVNIFVFMFRNIRVFRCTNAFRKPRCNYLPAYLPAYDHRQRATLGKSECSRSRYVHAAVAEAEDSNARDLRRDQSGNRKTEVYAAFYVSVRAAGLACAAGYISTCTGGKLQEGETVSPLPGHRRFPGMRFWDSAAEAKSRKQLSREREREREAPLLLCFRTRESILLLLLLRLQQSFFLFSFLSPFLFRALLTLLTPLSFWPFRNYDARGYSADYRSGIRTRE